MFVRSSKGKIAGYIAWPVVIAVLIIAAVFGLRAYGRDMAVRELDAARQSVERASVQCYALEGRYAPSLQYLEDNYGLSVDKDRYDVIYVFQQANLPPEIYVVVGEQGESR